MQISDMVRLNAMKSVKNPDDEYYTRFVFRWYSKTFHTPLHMVADIPMVDILTAYYEEMFENMEPDQLETEGRKMCMTPEEWAEKLRKEEEEELAFMDSFMASGGIEGVKLPNQKGKIADVQPIKDDSFSLNFEDVPI